MIVAACALILGIWLHLRLRSLSSEVQELTKTQETLWSEVDLLVESLAGAHYPSASDLSTSMKSSWKEDREEEEESPLNSPSSSCSSAGEDDDEADMEADEDTPTRGYCLSGFGPNALLAALLMPKAASAIGSSSSPPPSSSVVIVEEGEAATEEAEEAEEEEAHASPRTPEAQSLEAASKAPLAVIPEECETPEETLSAPVTAAPAVRNRAPSTRRGASTTAAGGGGGGSRSSRARASAGAVAAITSAPLEI